ncbi:MAG: CocE/NonD family hydrolase [Candidatus Thermoplasmatota archaeon]|nr:CocE/NonD family hydrolase [Candidatus Thermoplasmatota archaeon]
MMQKCVIGLIILLILSSVVVEGSQPYFENIKEKEKMSNLGGCTPVSSNFFRKTIMVEMRDGIHLATDVYRPKVRLLPHGSILVRTPYNKDNLAVLGLIFSLYGWPTVIQDMRGRFASEGEDTVFFNDHTDGADTLAWIANHSWSNGKIATIGLSALGIPQYLMAGTNPPELSCQGIIVATPNLYKHAIFQGGQLRKSLVEGWLEDQGSLQMLKEIIKHENYSLDYWTNVSLEDNWQDVNVPAIHMGGWYDIFLQGIIDGFHGYQNSGGPGAVGNSKLIIGPWTHVGFISRTQGELTYPLNSIRIFWITLLRDMIMQYTMNRGGGYMDWPAVSYYVMGAVEEWGAQGNEWRFADSWPVPSIQRLWYFHANGMLQTVPGGDHEPLTYHYDPMYPVPTRGGQNLNIEEGPLDQSSIETRDDVLIFTSAVLDEPYEVTGAISAHLFVSSDCVDTDFTVKVTDLYPDGRSMLITDGIVRMRNRNGMDHWEFMEPGSIYGVDVDLWSTSYIWNTGHRIRVAVSSSNYPRFLANPNTADGILQNQSYTVASNSVYVDAMYSSAIIFPEIMK